MGVIAYDFAFMFEIDDKYIRVMDVWLWFTKFIQSLTCYHLIIDLFLKKVKLSLSVE